MIPAAYISEWSQFAPWKSIGQIEQDLVISRALAEIYSDPFLAGKLAFRGGTALHKLFLQPQSRYSEDIDLVQIDEGVIGPVLDRIRHLLDPIFESNAKYKKTLISNKLTYRFLSELPPIQPLKLKIEINCREHFSELGFIKVPFKMNSRWYSGECEITSYRLEELMGTKLRALYQRNKGRDLFDLYAALTKAMGLDISKVAQSYHRYMMHSVGEVPSMGVYLANLEAKMTDPEFLGDISGLLRPEEKWNANQAYQLLCNAFLSKL